jgi:hypothetical protein
MARHPGPKKRRRRKEEKKRRKKEMRGNPAANPDRGYRLLVSDSSMTTGHCLSAMN